MTDKSIPANHQPKGQAYCDTPGTSCWYDEHDDCVNCGRHKGWRQAKRRSWLLKPIYLGRFRHYHVVCFGAHYYGDRAFSLEPMLTEESIFSTTFHCVNVGLEQAVLRPARPVLVDEAGWITYNRHTHEPDREGPTYPQELVF